MAKATELTENTEKIAISKSTIVNLTFQLCSGQALSKVEWIVNNRSSVFCHAE